MKKLITKLISKPITNQVIETENIQLWYVRWERRYGKFHSDTEMVMEVFTSEEEAKEFKQSLENAFKLIKHTSGAEVTIEKN